MLDELQLRRVDKGLLLGRARLRVVVRFVQGHLVQHAPVQLPKGESRGERTLGRVSLSVARLRADRGPSLITGGPIIEGDVGVFDDTDARCLHMLLLQQLVQVLLGG